MYLVQSVASFKCECSSLVDKVTIESAISEDLGQRTGRFEEVYQYPMRFYLTFCEKNGSRQRNCNEELVAKITIV
jgi:hypothetical protein